MTKHTMMSDLMSRRHGQSLVVHGDHNYVSLRTGSKTMKVTIQTLHLTLKMNCHNAGTC